MHSMATASEVDIRARVIGPSWQRLPADVARAVLKLNFEKRDLARIKRLSDRVGNGALSQRKQDELQQYAHVGRVIALMHSQARRVTPVGSGRSTGPC
jgi:hypothetical protein